MYPLLFSKSLWNKWKMKHAKFWKVFCQILFRFWKNEERFSAGQHCVEKAMKELLFWYDQISSWVQRKKATSEIVKCTKKFCVLENRLSTHNMVLSLELKAKKNILWKIQKTAFECPFEIIGFISVDQTFHMTRKPRTHPTKP